MKYRIICISTSKNITFGPGRLFQCSPGSDQEGPRGLTKKEAQKYTANYNRTSRPVNDHWMAYSIPDDGDNPPERANHGGQ